MRPISLNIYGIGNALVDILVEVDEQLISELHLIKGRQHVITESQSKILFDRIRFAHAKIAAGGSAANTIAMLAQLGAKAAFCGAVGEDEYGQQYEQETKEVLIKTGTLLAEPLRIKPSMRLRLRKVVNVLPLTGTIKTLYYLLPGKLRII